MKVYVVFQHGGFNSQCEQKRIKGVFDSIEKAEDCRDDIECIYISRPRITIETFELNKKNNF
jgi:hypothetical protein